MKKTITITDITKVRVRDKAYFKNCDFGFTVTDIDENDAIYTLQVDNPTCKGSTWSSSLLFDHATREVEVKEPEWPEPEDLDLHIYLGSDGVKYCYMPISESDILPWSILSSSDHSLRWWSAHDLASDRPEALPLTELKLVPKEKES